MRVHSGPPAAVAAALATTVLAAMIACDKSPTSPRPIGSPGPGGTIARLDVEVPPSIAPGTTVQLRAFAVYTTTQREEVTARATWRSTSPDVLDVDASGRATGRSEGQTGLVVSFELRSANRTVLVMPPDTWWVRGRVHDGALAVSDARVEVIDGIGAGKTTTTDALGSFRLFGVAGDVVFRASAAGFSAADVTYRVLTNGTILDFILQPAGPPRSLAGEWTLTFQAASDCQGLPDAARSRTYRATVAQSGASLDFSLSGAEFALDLKRPPTLQNRFRGRVVGEILTLVLTETVDYYSYGTERFDVAEQLGPNNLLAFVGTGSAPANGSVFPSGSFDGTISTGPFASGRVGCKRPNHRFSLTR